MNTIRYWQGSSQSQQHFNRSIELCLVLVPRIWKGSALPEKGKPSNGKMIDKAVELEPQEYLGYRGWVPASVSEDYEGAM